MVKLVARIVFLCDGLLEIPGGESQHAARFFRIAQKLPLELQMVLCHRVMGSAGSNIPGVNSEAAFKSLAKILQS